MKVLVTGGAGFIGSHLSEALVREGHAVRVLDDFSSGRAANLRAIARDVEVVRGDCADPRIAARAVAGREAVFHLAAIPSVARSVALPALSHHANGAGTVQILMAARDRGVRRVVFAGSSAVYGDLPGLPKRETMPTRPLSPYAIDKLMGEQYLRLFHELYGLETLTLRYFNVFGPRQDPSSPYSGVISLFATALVGGTTPTIYGDGRQTRDFTYVDDVVQANLIALRAKRCVGEAFNIATGEGITLLRLLRGIAAVTGRPSRARHEPARAGDIRHSVADVTRARKLLGYRPRVGFEEGLAKTVEWYRSAKPRRKARPRP